VLAVVANLVALRDRIRRGQVPQSEVWVEVVGVRLEDIAWLLWEGGGVAVVPRAI
jgi:hypothetical protein